VQADLLSSQRPNRLVCNLTAVADNLAALRRAIRPGTKVFAALKGNAYGFGLHQVAATLAEAGVDGIAVADQAEAVSLRQRGIRIPILLYAGHLASRETVRATSSTTWSRPWSRLAKPLNIPGWPSGRSTSS
jgi:alanine racemase